MKSILLYRILTACSNYLTKKLFSGRKTEKQLSGVLLADFLSDHKRRCRIDTGQKFLVKRIKTLRVMANDHAGTELKEEIKKYLESEGNEVTDFGTFDKESCDLSDFVYPAALAVSKGECDRGIFVDGVGYGSAMQFT